MLLPQGEFARFLRCGDDDRRDLLTKLFGTQLYDRITAELDRRRYDAARQRAEAAQAVIGRGVGGGRGGRPRRRPPRPSCCRCPVPTARPG